MARYRVTFMRKDNATTGSGTQFDETVEAGNETAAIDKATRIAQGKYPGKFIQFKGAREIS